MDCLRAQVVQPFMGPRGQYNLDWAVSLRNSKNLGRETIYIYARAYVCVYEFVKTNCSVAKNDLGTRVCSPLCRLIAKVEREKENLTLCPRKIVFLPSHLRMTPELISMWENTLLPTGASSDLIPFSNELDFPSIYNDLVTMTTDVGYNRNL